MHLKILIGVLFLSIATATPKADPKPSAKASPQYLQNYPSVQPSYYPGVSSYFGQGYAAQPILGQQSAEHYGVRFSPAGYGSFGAQQVSAGNYYQGAQPIPVPVAYSSGSAGYGVQSANYYGAARLWPKALISPAGSPSPVPEGLARAYYAVSTPSPLAFQSAAAVPVTTPSPIPHQPLIPVPVKVGSRNSFSQEINYNGIQNIPVPVSTPASYFANYQKFSTPAPFVQKYVQPTGYSFSTTGAPYTKYQQPSTRYQVNYQSTPAPFQAKYQHSTPAPPVQTQYQSIQAPAVQVKYHSAPSPPVQIKYQSTPAPPVQVTYKYREQTAPAHYPVQPSPAQYPFNYQLPAVSSRSPFASYQYQQPTAYSNVAQYQQTASPFGAPFATASPYSENYQRIPVPVAYSQSHFQAQPAQPALSYPVTTKPITVLPPSPTPVQTVSITENTFVPIPTTPTPIVKPQATIVKSEYNAGTVNPYYSHVSQYSTPKPFASVSNAYLPQHVGNNYHSYAPSNAYAAYSPSTAVSHVNFNGLGHSYSY